MKHQSFTADDVRRMLINPYYVIELDPGLVGDHQPLTSRDEWIQANTRLITEMGVDAWLQLLLDVLSGGSLNN